MGNKVNPDQKRFRYSDVDTAIKMGSCVFRCDVPHQWIPQRQAGPVSVYCDGVGCHVLRLRRGIHVWQHIEQSITATNRHRRDMTSGVYKGTLNPNKQQTIYHIASRTIEKTGMQEDKKEPFCMSLT